MLKPFKRNAANDLYARRDAAYLFDHGDKTYRFTEMANWSYKATVFLNYLSYNDFL